MMSLLKPLRVLAKTSLVYFSAAFRTNEVIGAILFKTFILPHISNLTFTSSYLRPLYVKTYSFSPTNLSAKGTPCAYS